MQFTLFGIIWILIFFFFMLKNSMKNIIYMTLLSAVLQCNSILSINGVGIGTMIFTSVMFILWSWFVQIRNNKIIINFDKIKLIILIIILAIILSLLTLSKDALHENILYIIQILIYAICFLNIRNISLKFDIEINDILVKIILFVLIIGIWQFLITTGLLPYNFVTTTLLYNETTNLSGAYISSMITGSKYIRIFSTFMEPSYCAPFLVGSFYYIVYNYKKIKNSILLLVWILLEIILTQSSTAYGAMIICAFIFLVLSNKKEILKYLIPLACITIIILLFNGSMTQVIFDKKNTGSYEVRTFWNQNALKKFQKNPILGVGYKNARASSLWYSILAQLGLVGLISYLLLISYYLKKFLKKNLNDVEYGSLFFFLSVFLCQIIAIPDLDFCVFWLALYILALNKNFNIKKEGRLVCE